jgi:hypothetical protein
MASQLSLDELIAQIRNLSESGKETLSSLLHSSTKSASSETDFLSNSLIASPSPLSQSKSEEDAKEEPKKEKKNKSVYTEEEKLSALRVVAENRNFNHASKLLKEEKKKAYDEK